jgi:hypothetical protein
MSLPQFSPTKERISSMISLNVSQRSSSRTLSDLRKEGPTMDLCEFEIRLAMSQLRDVANNYLPHSTITREGEWLFVTDSLVSCSLHVADTKERMHYELSRVLEERKG